MLAQLLTMTTTYKFPSLLLILRHVLRLALFLHLRRALVLRAGGQAGAALLLLDRGALLLVHRRALLLVDGGALGRAG